VQARYSYKGTRARGERSQTNDVLAAFSLITKEIEFMTPGNGSITGNLMTTEGVMTYLSIRQAGRQDSRKGSQNEQSILSTRFAANVANSCRKPQFVY